MWVDNLGLEDGTSYTGLSAMGLVRLKPHLVGQLIYTSDETPGDGIDDAVNEIGGLAAPRAHRRRALRVAQCRTRRPSPRVHG